MALAAVLGLSAAALAEDRFQVPARGEVIASGGSVDVRWTGPSDAFEQELVLSLDGGLTFPVRISAEMSPRRTAFRWTVPNLPTSHARLALRTGSGEGSEEETLELISEEFAIASVDADAPVELTRGTNEWWTRQALFGVLAEDLLAEAMGKAPERLVAAESCFEINEPDPPTPPAGRDAGERLRLGARPAAAASPSGCVARAGSHLPLRL